MSNMFDLLGIKWMDQDTYTTIYEWLVKLWTGGYAEANQIEVRYARMVA